MILVYVKREPLEKSHIFNYLMFVSQKRLRLDLLLDNCGLVR